MGIRKNLIINKLHIDQIIENCKDGLPNEACGIIAKKGNEVVKVFSINNIDKSPYNYHLDSGEQFKVMKELEYKCWEIAGFYHSHVNTKAIPSETDMSQITYPDTCYFIVSLKNIDIPEIKAYKISNHLYEKVKFEVKE